MFTIPRDPYWEIAPSGNGFECSLFGDSELPMLTARHFLYQGTAQRFAAAVFVAAREAAGLVTSAASDPLRFGVHQTVPRDPAQFKWFSRKVADHAQVLLAREGITWAFGYPPCPPTDLVAWLASDGGGIDVRVSTGPTFDARIEQINPRVDDLMDVMVEVESELEDKGRRRRHRLREVWQRESGPQPRAPAQ